MSALAIINILYSIQKFNDYEPLIKAIEGGDLAVMKDETIHKITVGLLRGKKLGVGLDGNRTGRNRNIVRRDKYLVEYFNIYVTLGFPKYSSYDEDQIKEGKPRTAAAKLHLFYNDELVNNDFFEPLAYGSILSIIKNSINQSAYEIKPLGFENVWLPIYYREKHNIDMLKLKDNVKGTWYDFDIYPDAWEHIDPDFFGGDNNK